MTLISRDIINNVGTVKAQDTFWSKWKTATLKETPYNHVMLVVRIKPKCPKSSRGEGFHWDSYLKHKINLLASFLILFRKLKPFDPINNILLRCHAFWTGNMYEALGYVINSLHFRVIIFIYEKWTFNYVTLQKHCDFIKNTLIIVTYKLYFVSSFIVWFYKNTNRSNM